MATPAPGTEQGTEQDKGQEQDKPQGDQTYEVFGHTFTKTQHDNIFMLGLQKAQELQNGNDEPKDEPKDDPKDDPKDTTPSLATLEKKVDRAVEELTKDRNERNAEKTLVKLESHILTAAKKDAFFKENPEEIEDFVEAVKSQIYLDPKAQVVTIFNEQKEKIQKQIERRTAKYLKQKEEDRKKTEGDAGGSGGLDVAGLLPKDKSKSAEFVKSGGMLKVMKELAAGRRK